MRDKELEDYAKISALAGDKQYAEALEIVANCGLPESTRTQLTRVLESGEDYVIKRVFGELDGRIAQTLCWGCWHTPGIGGGNSGLP
jgi:hypothetical protein